MARVLLKRDWRTPYGRFYKSSDGVPGEIPDGVLRKHPLPKDAEVVDESYITPAEQAVEDSYSEGDMGLSASEQEEEIRRRVNEEVDRREAAKASGGEDDTPQEEEGPLLLDGSVKEVIAELSGMSAGELRALRSEEQEGKNRATLIVEIEAAIEDVEG